MVMKRICAMLESCATESPLFPPTLLYKEGWLVRLVVDWFALRAVRNHPLAFQDNARWYSEAWLPSAFLKRPGGDPLAESWTQADAAIGHFEIGREGKADLSLLRDGKQLVVLEAKLFSDLASGVTHAEYYDQAARTVACIAEVLKRASRRPSELTHLGFYVLAPQSQIDAGRFDSVMDRESMRRKVEQRVAEYGGARDKWYAEWFQPAFERMATDVVSWEDLIETIGEHDSASAAAIEQFYQQCIRYGQSARSP